ncbi:hypothetical protein GUJ93_ZPchr0013g34398 [Zizania palustris]|uniref:Uncharacterized protein n=1 Tax=Zizania palustris TaxID=103762 RepID=A0A8J5X0Q2_ZIZPA|nr:hypothetical protein GUJ93_ZPchr0013g34398 [Zizania palustris]
MISKFLEKAVPPNLRNAIADKVYSDMGIKESEVFISDGAQCDIARLQTEKVDDGGKYAEIEYMRCASENAFFSDLSRVRRTGVMFFWGTSRRGSSCDSWWTSCGGTTPSLSPPTRPTCRPVAVRHGPSTRSWARGRWPSRCHPSPSLPGSRAYGSARRAVVPDELLYSDGSLVARDFDRIVRTCFNGASSIAQVGGRACLSEEGHTAI